MCIRDRSCTVQPSSGSGELARFSVTVPEDLLAAFDEQISRRGDVTNRSEAIRDLIRASLVRETTRTPEAVSYTHLELVPDATDVLADLRGVARGVPAPYALVYGISVEHLAGALAQQGDDVELKFGEVDGRRDRVIRLVWLPPAVRSVDLHNPLRVIDGQFANCLLYTSRCV